MQTVLLSTGWCMICSAEAGSWKARMTEEQWPVASDQWPVFSAELTRTDHWLLITGH
jgi:hypothetical protein